MAPSPIDLATLQACKDWIGITNTAGDSNIQRCLTAFSLEFLRMTGRGPRNWQTATASPFNQPVVYSEVYDGNGSDHLFLRNFPITAIGSLTAYGSALQPQTSPGGSGYAIDNQGRSIVLVQNYVAFGPRFALYSGGPGFPLSSAYGGFPCGPQIIGVTYTAGFAVQSVANALYTVIPAWQAAHAYAAGVIISDGTFIEQAIASGTSGAVAPPWAGQQNGTTPDGTGNLVWQNSGIQAAPYTVVVQSDTVVLTDGGVKYFSSGIPLTQVFTSPAAGQYYLVAPGSYLFNAADAGVQVQISYTAAGTPADIVQATLEAVSLNYKRRDWEGISSLSMKDVGQTTYTQFAMSKSVKDVVMTYKRASMAA